MARPQGGEPPHLSRRRRPHEPLAHRCGRQALVVSQFTLAAETKGNRPGFSTAAAPEEGRRLYEHFSDAIRAHGVTTANGTFGADMKAALTNDGPVTVWLDTEG
jgi:D-aminoacyl-tRNA deacylase